MQPLQPVFLSDVGRVPDGHSAVQQSPADSYGDRRLSAGTTSLLAPLARRGFLLLNLSSPLLLNTQIQTFDLSLTKGVSAVTRLHSGYYRS